MDEAEFASVKQFYHDDLLRTHASEDAILQSVCGSVTILWLIMKCLYIINYVAFLCFNIDLFNFISSQVGKLGW
jgi:hypothetical protein